MTLELLYFPQPGKAEPTRLTLAVGGVEFTDTRLTGEQWGAKKPEVAPRQMPLLYVDGKIFGQSVAQLRYAGKISKVDGSPLYPSDPLEALAVDEMLDYAGEWFIPMSATWAMTDEAEKMAARAKLVAPGGDAHKWVKFVDDLLGKSTSGFAVGDKLTIADMGIFCWIQLLRSGMLDGIPTTCLDEFTNIMAHKAKIAAIPQVKEYYKDATDVRTVFQ